VTAKKVEKGGGYAVCHVQIERNVDGAQRHLWPTRPFDEWALLRDAAADSGRAAKEEEGERWEVAGPAHGGLL
jgi:hypothetical protein